MITIYDTIEPVRANKLRFKNCFVNYFKQNMLLLKQSYANVRNIVE